MTRGVARKLKILQLVKQLNYFANCTSINLLAWQFFLDWMSMHESRFEVGLPKLPKYKSYFWHTSVNYFSSGVVILHFTYILYLEIIQTTSFMHCTLVIVGLCTIYWNIESCLMYILYVFIYLHTWFIHTLIGESLNVT